MRRSKALVVMSSQIRHVCPYKGQDMPIALCYKRSQDIEDTFCYACDYVPYLKRKFGLRTFRRRAVVSVCARCLDPAALHSDEPPHVGTRSKCDGFIAEDDQATLWVALDSACTSWMTVNAATGERTPKGQRLVGAPGSVLPDCKDSDRKRAADEAQRRRLGLEHGNSKLRKKADD